MFRSYRFQTIFCLGAVALLSAKAASASSSLPSTGQEIEGANASSIAPQPQTGLEFEIVVPSEATVELEGVKMEGVGERRRFQTPPGAASGQYAYTVKVIYNGKDVTKKLNVVRGASNSFDLRPDFQTGEVRSERTAVVGGPSQGRKPNIVTIISDDFGYGDAGCYGGGEGRGMPTPHIDRLAKEGMVFQSFYGQPSCTPGRAAMLTGRFPNRSGMTTVAFQGQGGGLPKAEWTTAAVLKTAGYKTFFTGKWHLGEADYALPNAHGFDEMKYCGIYHLNAYTYGDPTWFPDMPDALRAMFNKVTKGMMSGNAGEVAKEEFKVNGQYVDKPGKPITMDGVTYPDGVVGVPFLDAYIEKAALEYLDRNGKSETPFFMSINFMKVHQPNMPHPDYIHKSMSKSKYADSVVEADARIGRIMDKLRSLGLDDGNTLVFWTTDNGAWQDVYPDCGYTPFRGTKGTDREGGNRVPAIAWMPKKIKADSRNNEIIGGLDFMATFAAMGGAKLPENDKENKPMIFDSFDMSPVLFGTGKSPRETWSYFTENELLPGAVRYHNYKFLFNLRGDNGAHTGGLAVDSNLGWKGPEKYVATVPQVFDLWADPQERYDLFMNNFTERTWLGPVMGQELERIGKTFVKYPPRKLQSDGYTGPVTISQYEKFEGIKKQLEKQNINIGTGN